MSSSDQCPKPAPERDHDRARSRSRSPVRDDSSDSSFGIREPREWSHAGAASIAKMRDNFADENKQKEVAEQMSRWQAEFAAEEERRRNLTAGGRLREDGQKLLTGLEGNADATFVLDRTPRYAGSNSRRAKCRAEECINEARDDAWGTSINEKFRICLDAGGWHGPFETGGKQYYHIECFEKMMDNKLHTYSGTPLFMPDKVQHLTGFGLMIAMWLYHKGRVDIDKIEDYITAFVTYDTPETSKSAVDEWKAWESVHGKCLKPLDQCGCLSTRPLP